MILMGMGEDRRGDRVIAKLLKKWGGSMPRMLRMHPTIENHGIIFKVETVAVGTDARSPG